MPQITRTTRSALVTGLIFSLMTATLSPALMASAATAETTVGTPFAAQVCCCGTADCSCCGMACCGVDGPKPQRAPLPHDGRGEPTASPLLAFCQTSPKWATDEPVVCFGWGNRSTAAQLRGTTLQALNVLLQT